MDGLRKQKNDVSKAIAEKKKKNKKDPCEAETKQSKEIGIT